MRQIVSPQWKQKIRNFFLDLDARIDSTLFSSGKGLRELYERYSTFMDRFYVGRWKRWVFIEPLSEAATIGLGGLILMLALAVPAFRETADDDWLKKSDLAVSFLDRYGNPIGSRGIKHNDSIPLEDFPDNLIKATLATEDRRFYDHFGIDIAGTARALVTNAQAGGVRQGGSSITQQLAKNLFLNNERTIERKVKEAFLAIWLETRLTKNEILKLYLDRAYMGGGTFGVDGAAHFYFNKSARDVNLAESAMLAGLFKAPTKYAPHINLPAARARANVVLDNLVDAGFMTEGQVFGARRNPADRRRPPRRKFAELLSRLRLRRDAQAGRHLSEILCRARLRGPHRDRHERAARRRRSRRKPVAPVRPRLSRDAGRHRGRRSRRRRSRDGRRPRLWREPVQPRGRRLPAAGFVVQAICLHHRAAERLQAELDRGRRPGLHRQLVPAELWPLLFRLGDADAGDHPLDQRRAGQTVDRARRQVAEPGQGRPRQDHRGGAQFGLTAPLPDTPSMPIGSDEVTVLEHAVAYATFPNKGKSVKPHAVLEVRTGAGDLVWRFDRDGKKPLQAIPASVAADMAGMMSHVVSEGTARRAALDGIPTAGKTGTTNAYRDAWFVGYTGNFTCAVWYGNDDYSPTNRMTGGSLPAQTWHDIMVAAHQGVEVKEIAGIGMGTKLPQPALPATVAANGAPKILETKPGPPPVLTKRGADILVRVEKLLDDAGKTAGKTSSNDPSKQPAKPVTSSALAFPENLCGGIAAPATTQIRPAPPQELIAHELCESPCG